MHIVEIAVDVPGDRIHYWIGRGGDKPREFAITFIGAYQNCHRDGVVESMLFFQDVADRRMRELESQGKRPCADNESGSGTSNSRPS